MVRLANPEGLPPDSPLNVWVVSSTRITPETPNRVAISGIPIRQLLYIASLINFINSAWLSTGLNYGNCFFTFSGAWMRKPTCASIN